MADPGGLGYLTGGELVACGRATDVLFAAGRNVFAQDVEWTASGVADVRTGNIAAFGVGEGADEALVVVVESRSTDHDRVRRAVTAAVSAGNGLRPRDVLVLPPGCYLGAVFAPEHRQRLGRPGGRDVRAVPLPHLPAAQGLSGGTRV